MAATVDGVRRWTMPLLIVLLGAVAVVAQRSDPELPDEHYVVFRVHATGADAAFEKQLEWNRWMMDPSGAESHRFRLSVVVRQGLEDRRLSM